MSKSFNSHSGSVLKQQTNWRDLWFYKKAVVLYQLTYVFTRRFLPAYGDRTVDQMVQAARSGKQNIVEGTADGVTSTEMELKLLNVERASIQELLEDYEDYIVAHRLVKWIQGHERYDLMLTYCREHNELADYEKFFEKWSNEEMANIAVTLCRMIDKMMSTYQKQKEDDFVKNGGIRERMTAARLGYRNIQQQTIDDLTNQLETLKEENNTLKKRIAELEAQLFSR